MSSMDNYQHRQLVNYLDDEYCGDELSDEERQDMIDEMEEAKMEAALSRAEY